MCVYFICKSKWPSDRDIIAGGEHNSDGAGIAWVDPETKKVEWIKGLKDGKDIIKILDTGKVPFPAIIHFRIASIGKVCPELTHPFPLLPQVPLDLKGSAPSVVFHNGTWKGWHDYLVPALAGQPIKKAWPAGPWSDTRALAWYLARGGAEALDMLYEHAGLGGDRVAILDGNGGIYTRGDFKERDGYSVSNDYFEYRTKSWDTRAKGAGKESHPVASNFPGGGGQNKKITIAAVLGAGGRVLGGPSPTAHIPQATWETVEAPGSGGAHRELSNPEHLVVVLRALREMKQRDVVSAGLNQTGH